MDDAETSRVQFVKQHWQCFGGPLMNVVQQHYPLPLTLKSLETALGYLIRCNLFPVIRNDAGAPDYYPVAAPRYLSIAFCTAETRKIVRRVQALQNPPDVFADRANALLYFPLGAVYGERCKIERMIFSMSSDRMTLTIGTAHLVRIAVCHAPNDEKGCFHEFEARVSRMRVAYGGNGPSSKVKTTSWSLRGSVSGYCEVPTRRAFVWSTYFYVPCSRSIGIAWALARDANHCPWKQEQNDADQPLHRNCKSPIAHFDTRSLPPDRSTADH